MQFARTEGIIPAPESAHAIRAAIVEALAAKEAGEERTILFGLCGHGHFDLAAYDAYLGGTLEDPEFSEAGSARGARRAARWGSGLGLNEVRENLPLGASRDVARQRAAVRACGAHQREEGGDPGARTARWRCRRGRRDRRSAASRARRRASRAAGAAQTVVGDGDLEPSSSRLARDVHLAGRSRSRYGVHTAFVTASETTTPIASRSTAIPSSASSTARRARATLWGSAGRSTSSKVGLAQPVSLLRVCPAPAAFTPGRGSSLRTESTQTVEKRRLGGIDPLARLVERKPRRAIDLRELSGARMRGGHSIEKVFERIASASRSPSSAQACTTLPDF